jgi:hypothetical protein
MSKPDDYGVDNPLSIVINHLEKGDYIELAENLLDVFAKTASDIEQCNLIAKLYSDIRSNQKAEEWTLKTLKMCTEPQQKYNVRANLAKFYNGINEPLKSLQYSKINLAVNPKSPDVLLEMVFSYFLNGELDKSEKILRELKARESELEQHHRDITNFNLGTYDMLQGKFLHGLAGFLLNVQRLDLWFNNTPLPFKHWTGGSYPGKTLVMHMAGSGFGDELISIRWLDKAKELGFRPVYHNYRKDLYPFFIANGYECIDELEKVPKDSLWCFIMQAPLWFEMKPEKVIRENYLKPSEKTRQKWAWIKDSKKIKVGLRNIGNLKNNKLLYRHIELEEFMESMHKTFDGYDVEFYSLQKGDGEEEMAARPDVITVSDQIKSFDDTFAMVENLDYVVTTCTSVLHAAAISGTKTIGLVPIAAYFTYLSPPTPGRPENTSIWYGDNFRFFKQVKPKNWELPLQQAHDYIREDLKLTYDNK